MNFISKLFNKKQTDLRIKHLKKNVIKNREKSTNDLKILNKKMKFLIEAGQMEITIKSIKGVVKEIK